MKEPFFAKKCLPFLLCFFGTVGVADASLGTFELILGGFVLLAVAFWYVVAFVAIGMAQFVTSKLGKARVETRMRTFLRRANLFLTPLLGPLICFLFIYAGSGASSSPTHHRGGGGGGVFLLLAPSVISCLFAYAFNWFYLSIVEPNERETWFTLRTPQFLQKWQSK